MFFEGCSILCFLLIECIAVHMNRQDTHVGGMGLCVGLCAVYRALHSYAFILQMSSCVRIRISR